VMKKAKNTVGSEHRLAWILLTSLSALALVAVLSLALSQADVRAEPAQETVAAVLELSKQVNEDTAAPGDTLTYTLRVENVGDVAADAWLTDTLPDGLSYVVGTFSATSGDWGVQGRTLTWTAELVGYSYATLTFNAEISSELTYAEIVNTAVVTGAGELVQDSASTTAAADLGNLDTGATLKSVSSEEGEPGDVLTYTIRIENTDVGNPYDVPNVRLTDTLPAHLTYVSGSLSVLDPTASIGVHNNVITWMNTLDYPSWDEIQFSVEISPGAPRDSWITNTVEIVAPLQAFTRTAGTYIRPDLQYVYLPLLTRRWPPVPYKPTLDDINNPDQNGDYTVSWSYDAGHPDVTEPVTYTLQEATQEDPSDWTTVYEGSGTSQPFTDKDGGTYYYRVRGHNAFGAGEWSDVKSTSVIGEPFAPDLDEIDNDDEDQSYRVSWSYDDSYPAATQPDSYILEEAENDAFTEDLRTYDPATDEDCEFDATGGYCDLDNDSGTYYYRVRGQNQHGVGPWSNVEDVYVWEYEDDFSDEESGWPRLWERTRGALYQVAPYEHPDCGPNKDCKYEDGHGYIVARRAEENPRALFTPDVEIPSTKYGLEVDARWWEASVNATYEIFFSSEDDFDTYYAVKVRIDNPDKPGGERPKCEYRVYQRTDEGDEIFTDFWNRSDSINCGVVYCNGDDSCGNTAWNEWKIQRDDNWISVEVNGDLLYSGRHDDPLGADRVFGFGATNYEGFTPAKPVFDKLEVELED